jgi:hypothetical protein
MPALQGDCNFVTPGRFAPKYYNSDNDATGISGHCAIRQAEVLNVIYVNFF